MYLSGQNLLLKMSKQDVTIGVDIGGTNTKLGIVDRSGNCLSGLSIYTHAKEQYSLFLGNLFAAIEHVTAAAGGKDSLNIRAVGVGAPNANYFTGLIENAPNLGWGEKVPLAKSISEKIGLPVWCTNDANAAAIGELKFGVAKGLRNFVVITLGTGLGSGIVVNGSLVYGHDGFAGELGHVLVYEGGRLCGCGKRGCLETYVSATGIKRTVFALMADYNIKSELSGVSFDNLTAAMISTAANNGDKIALEAFETTGRILGMKLADTIAHLSPEAIVLFGGLAKAGDLIMEPTRKYMDEFSMEIFKGKTKLLFSNLEGDNTAILGSAALAWNELDNPGA